MDEALRLRRGQRELTSAQAAEAKRFADERIRAQLSTEPVDEALAEALLCQSYTTAGLDAPQHLHWLDGPLELVAVLAHVDASITIDGQYRDHVPHCVWDDAVVDHDEIALLHYNAGASVDYRIRRLARTARERIITVLDADRPSAVHVTVQHWMGYSAWDPVRTLVADRLWKAVGDAAGYALSSRVRDRDWFSADFSFWHSICAYDEVAKLADLRFYDEYLTRNAAGALARFNELVSGYWLGRAFALLVRKPRLLSRDEEGRLHSATGPCVAYHDGWGFYAWHGVRVPGWVIRRPPEEWTRDDFFGEPNVEARRVIQERMGERFIWEIGARFVDGGSRGVLYEVDLPGDPDRVARYLQVQDPSTGRVYHLRVPPRMASAAEAAAWTFGLSIEEYHPAHET